MQSEAVTRWGVRIADPGMEADFRAAQLPANRRKLGIAILAMAIFSGVLFGHALLQTQPDRLVLAARGFTIVLMTATFCVVLRIRTHQAVEWTALGSYVACTCVFLLLLSLRSDFTHLAGATIVGLAVIGYLMSPNSLALTSAAVISFSATAFAIWLIRHGHALPSGEILYTALWAVNANILGFVGCRSLKYWQRVQYCHARLLETLSTHDALTGLYNRLFFETAYERSLRQAQRTGRPLSLIMIDVDHFKLFNDHRGHVAGDACLRDVAAALSVALGQHVLARYGGEEFACLLPEADREAAGAAARSPSTRSRGPPFPIRPPRSVPSSRSAWGSPR